jgi:CheY-like chemotaxis protein
LISFFMCAPPANERITAPVADDRLALDVLSGKGPRDGSEKSVQRVRPIRGLVTAIELPAAGPGKDRCVKAPGPEVPPPAVLIVEDHQSNREMMARMLSEAGYRVQAAGDGPEALALLTGRRADLYVVDYLMPSMNGPELVRRIRQQHADAKVLYVTAVSEQLFEETRLLRENEAFLQKPFGARDLREAVSLLLFGHIRGLD